MRRDHARHEGERLSAFLDDELVEADALAVTRHLSACDTCMAELEEIRAARSALRQLPNIDPPLDLLTNIASVAALDRQRWSRSARVVAVAIAGTALITGAAFAAGGADDGTVAPPIERFVIDHVSRVGGGPMLTPVDLGR